MTTLFELYEKSPNHWAYSSWIDPKIGYFYIETPKVACTKIKKVLQQLSGFELPTVLNDIHYRQPPNDYVPSLAKFIDDPEILVGPGLFKFCFVRHPADRVVSAYKDKIQRSRGPFWERYRVAIRTKHELTAEDEITLMHFLQWISDLPDGQRDIHWRSQAGLLRPQVFKYDFIGRLEQFDADFSHVLEQLKVIEPDRLLEGRENTTEDVPKVALPKSACRMIEKIYAEDFQLFNYD